jgi:hypothetical protein
MHDPPLPSASADDANRPGAHGVARLWHGGKWLYFFGRKAIYQLEMLICRRTDGRTYTDWSTVPVAAQTRDFPAAAGLGGAILLCWRDATSGVLMLTRTTDGVRYPAPRSLGVVTTAAPAAVYEPDSAQWLICYRDTAGGLACLRSSDGLHFAPPCTLALPGPLASAPVLTLARRAGRWAVIVQAHVGDALYACEAVAGRRFGPWSLLTRRGLGGRSTRDYPVTQRVGPNLIAPTRYERPEYGGADPWPFTLAATAAMAPTAVKVNLFYEGNYPRPIFNEAHLDDLLALGIDTVIFRTAEYRIARDDVAHQLETVDINSGTGRAASTYLDYVRRHPLVTFLVEVGNEPNLGTKSAAATRRDLLSVIRHYDTDRYRRDYPNLRWLVSLPYDKAFDRGEAGIERALNYLDAIIDSPDAPDESREIECRYDGYAVHLYGVDRHFADACPRGGDRAALAQQYPQQLPAIARPPGQISDPDAARFLDRTMRATALPIYITEAGTFGQLPPPGLPWIQKAEEYVHAIARLPRQVEMVIIFAVTLKDDAHGGGFAACPVRLAIDADCRGNPEPTDLAGARRIGAR